MIDALKRASANTINVIMPYYGYARQDRKASGREPITSKLSAKLIGEAGADRVVCLDLPQLKSLVSSMPLLIMFSTAPVLVDYMKRTIDMDNLVVVSPDVGGVARA